jgi:hypothetical protein
MSGDDAQGIHFWDHGWARMPEPEGMAEKRGKRRERAAGGLIRAGREIRGLKPDF